MRSKREPPASRSEAFGASPAELTRARLYNCGQWPDLNRREAQCHETLAHDVAARLMTPADAEYLKGVREKIAGYPRLARRIRRSTRVATGATARQAAAFPWRSQACRP